MKIENFKMKVTPEQSKRVQEVCFTNGITWNSGSAKTGYIGVPYLFLRHGRLLSGWDIVGEEPEITYEEFISTYVNPPTAAQPHLNPAHLAIAFRIFGPCTDADNIAKIVNIILDRPELFRELAELEAKWKEAAK